jgi:hypothetical protein
MEELLEEKETPISRQVKTPEVTGMIGRLSVSVLIAKAVTSPACRKSFGK